ncbi:centromere/kinetochore protein zw10 homolog [Neocloeon triangulifer]|uniref:centromere/kinetochore protein zw10 homolog n=1 Tax=Neocloeon triangulifer TaxID=2078957 RepID=UPI00286F95F2|nr:centromere/kinetochore protein zw10 homolog [Neocloeon triangulifer]XP_059485988.1 centromere/kinetochore protein zw10 homolog [Neocloeon triangulifer]
MSIVAEILSSRGKLEFEDVSSKLAAVQEAVDASVEQARSMLSHKYKQFRLHQENNQRTLLELQKLSTTMESLKTRIETQTKADIQNTSSELKTLSDALRKVNLKASCTKGVLEIDRSLGEVDQLLKSKRLHLAAQISMKMQTVVKETDDIEPEVMKAVKINAIIAHEQLLNDISNIWKNSVVCHHEDEERLFVLKIKPDPLPELIAALQLIGNDHMLQTFANRLLDNPMSTVMTKSTCYECETGQVTIKVSSDKRPAVLDVVECLAMIFEVLNAPATSDGRSLLSMIGHDIGERFCHMFIEEVLQKSVPVTAQEKSHFVEHVGQKIEDMQVFLTTSGFLKESQTDIMDYVQNIDLHFINKTCERYLEKSREIIFKDLHNTIDLDVEEGGIQEDINEDPSYSSLSSATTKFPKCSISASAKEILELVMEMLSESSKSTGMKAERLYLTARNALESYCSLTPIYHKKYLDSLPQQAAIFHNNCMYLAHQMLILGPHFSTLLSKSLQLQSITFFDIIVKLRKTGCQVFLDQMQVQRKQLVELLRDSQITHIGESDHLPSKTEKCVRQCLRQLEVLQHVCQPVLPEEIFNKAIGALVNSVVEEMIVRICSVEDIPASAASDLVTVCSLVIDKAPRLLTDPNKIHQYVKRWGAFEELMQVLSGNLATIEARWAHRMGPLAQEFSANQVKQLIKALFQNTARRAAVLANIE